jgi:hypothetical protein
MSQWACPKCYRVFRTQQSEPCIYCRISARQQALSDPPVELSSDDRGARLIPTAEQQRIANESDARRIERMNAPMRRALGDYCPTPLPVAEPVAESNPTPPVPRLPSDEIHPEIALSMQPPEKSVTIRAPSDWTVVVRGAPRDR